MKDLNRAYVDSPAVWSRDHESDSFEWIDANDRDGNVFAFVRWAANDYGTVVSRIDILRAVSAGEAFQTLPFVRPGGDILLRIHGWPKVEMVLNTIDAIETLGIDPADVAPDHWRHVHNRLSVNEPFRSYTCEQHRAWLKRRSVLLASGKTTGNDRTGDTP
jgi:hypothetical protein